MQGAGAASAQAAPAQGAAALEPAADTGLASLTLLLRFHGIPADPAQIAHRAGGVAIGVTEMLHCAKALKLKARAIHADWAQLAKLALPAIAECADGTYIILGRMTEEGALVQAPFGRPQILKREQFEANWTGRLVLMARRASLSDLTRRFDVT